MKPVKGSEGSLNYQARLTEIKNELSDLERCNVLLPPDAVASGRLVVVPAHMLAEAQSRNGPSYQYMTT